MGLIPVPSEKKLAAVRKRRRKQTLPTTEKAKRSAERIVDPNM